MTQQGFEEYLIAVYGNGTGTTKSYVKAIRIIDEMFLYEDVFGLSGRSIATIDDFAMLNRIADFVCAQQTLFQKGNDSIFRNISPNQNSYPRNSFCSAAIKQLLKYYAHNLEEEKAQSIFKKKSQGKQVSKQLLTLFDIEKEGKDEKAVVKVRLGQSYFRKMVLTNFGYKCCVTGLDVPQTLRASHIVSWASDKVNRMNPENGLCLSATYDAAFDQHLISFDDDYRMILSKDIKEYYTSDVSKQYFQNFERKQISLPIHYLPSKKLLAKHREMMENISEIK
jgi:putative restriction endonuclease